MTRKITQKAALLSAFVLTAALAGCGAENSGQTEVSDMTVTEENTVAVNTEQLNDEDKQAVNDAADALLTDEELENKTIKWLAHYDLNPDSRGGSKSVALEMFESKYGGEIKYYPTTWQTRWTDLSTAVLGGEGIDFFPFETEAVPKGVISGMFIPVDDYIDLDSEIWQHTAKFMDMLSLNGKHYEMCTGVSPEAVVIYSKKTISENGFDDPWELYQNGQWNWDSFKSMLTDFVDTDAGHYGLDGYYYQKALGTSSGCSAVKLNDGLLELTIDDPALEKAMNLAEDMYGSGLFLDKSLFDWSEQPQKMGEGGELFYFCGAWVLESDPSVWSTKLNPNDAAMVPVPCSPDYDPAYSIIPDGFMLCKGAANPEGVARYAECCIAASLDESARSISDEKRKKDYGWTDELLEQYYECINSAKEYPFYDLSYGISSDFITAVTDNVMYNPFGGSSYAQGKEESREVAQMLIDEANDKLRELV